MKPASTVRVLTACLVAISSGALAAPATAGTQGPTISMGRSHGLEYLKADYEQVVSQAGPHADCDNGRVAVGGGGTVAGDPATAHLSATSVTDSAGAGWTTEATAHIGARTVTSYAICGKDPVVWESSNPTQVPGNSELGIGNECPMAGQKVTAGGLSADGGDIQFEANLSVATEPFDWSTIVFNHDLSDSLVEQWLGCSSELKTTSHLDTIKVEAGTAGKLKVGCGNKEVVTGGGFNFAKQFGFEPTGVQLNTSIPIDNKSDKDKVPDDGWLIKAYNGSAGKETLRAQAICAKT